MQVRGGISRRHRRRRAVVAEAEESCAVSQEDEAGPGGDRYGGGPVRRPAGRWRAQADPEVRRDPPRLTSGSIGGDRCGGGPGRRGAQADPEVRRGGPRRGRVRRWLGSGG